MKLKIEKINVKMKKNVTITQKISQISKTQKNIETKDRGKGDWEKPSLPDLPDPWSDFKLRMMLRLTALYYY